MSTPAKRQSVAAAVHDLFRYVDERKLGWDIRYAFDQGQSVEAAERFAVHIDTEIRKIARAVSNAHDPARAAYMELLLIERFRLYYAAREANPRFALELLENIEAVVNDMPTPPDLGRIRAAVEQSDLIEAAVRFLKPRDKRLFNALPNHFRRVDVEAVAAGIDYSAHTAYRRAVPRFVKLGLLERTDGGYCKAVANLPT